MQTSILLQALLAVIDWMRPGADFTLVFIVASMIISIVGIMCMVYALLGYKMTNRPSELPIGLLLLGIPFILLVSFGIFMPLLLGSWLAGINENVLEQAGVLPLFNDSRLYGEVLLLVAVFAVVCALYLVRSQRILTLNRARETWLATAVTSCGMEIVAATVLLFVSLARLSGLDVPLTHSMVGRIFYYAALIVAFKTLEQIFILIYVELFGVRRLDVTRPANDFAHTDFATLKRVVRKHCGYLPAPLCAGILVLLVNWAVGFATQFGLLGLSRMLLRVLHSLWVLILPFALTLVSVLAIRAVWTLFPATHPLIRALAKSGDPDATARQFLAEYASPLFIAGDVRVTKIFLIQESLVIKAFYLPALAGIERVNSFMGGRSAFDVLKFADGQTLKVLPEQTRLLEYARCNLSENSQNRVCETVMPHELPQTKRIKQVMRMLAACALAVAGLTFIWNLSDSASWNLSAADPAYVNSFNENRSALEEVVYLIETEGNGANGRVNGRIMLPEAYEKLSQTGYVQVEMGSQGANVFFYWRLGILGSYSGFAYLASDKPPQYEFGTGDKFQRIESLVPHWYYVVSS
ncbi:MAG: hypothetical protein LBT32_02340 [Peptococcaceae bacterium]|jgi:hypothetical protein|nr:hypothetical protein [Peptococcaceae bacterium]